MLLPKHWETPVESPISIGTNLSCFTPISMWFGSLLSFPSYQMSLKVLTQSLLQSCVSHWWLWVWKSVINHSASVQAPSKLLGSWPIALSPCGTLACPLAAAPPRFPPLPGFPPPGGALDWIGVPLGVQETLAKFTVVIGTFCVCILDIVGKDRRVVGKFCI